MNAPIAKKQNHSIEKHTDQRNDPYYWMNQREDPELLQYLEDENKYADDMMADTNDLQNELFEEMKARYKKDDESLPYFFNNYWYIVRYEEGKEYPIFTRKRDRLTEPEEILLDANQLAEGLDYFEIASLTVSPDNKILAFSFDTIGRRLYEIQFKNLETGAIFEDKITNNTGKIVWANDNQHVFYITKDDSLRADKVFRHQLGHSIDTLVYHELDDTFDVSLFKSKSLEYIFIATSSTNEDEQRFIPSNNVHAEWTIVQERTEDLEYSVEHYKDLFYIITNADEATNFKIVTTSVETPALENWIDYIPHRENVLLEGFEIFKNYFVIEEREEGLLQIKIIDHVRNSSHYLEFLDPTYTAYIGINLEFDTSILRYGYTSLTQPNSTFEYDMEKHTSTLLKQQAVLGGQFDSNNYISERIWATARDGKKIPISLVYYKNTPKSKDTPLLLYGYGSYGVTIDASFSNVRLSLLDRGFIYAIAHIRGGEYLGREWYEDGKMLQKKNTFTDFIDAGIHLCAKAYTSPSHLYAMGGSAGGLLIGAVINMKNNLFNGVVAQVPFVDVVTTMLDDSIPLTTGEYDEWGNPNEEDYYHYMKSYSPYDNVIPQDYPHCLITTGFHDSQVQYWEPAKWTAKLRDLKTNDNLLLFKTDMTSGHGGASGRFESLKEIALEYAFLLKIDKNNAE